MKKVNTFWEILWGSKELGMNLSFTEMKDYNFYGVGRGNNDTKARNAFQG
jgi:hypothetical protein